MSKRYWPELLSALDVKGTLEPVSEKDLDTFEKTYGITLPASYRSFCSAVGPGLLANWYTIAVPLVTKRHHDEYDLLAKTGLYHSGLEWTTYHTDPPQFERAIVFADDCTGTIYYWDPKTRNSARECRIYALFRDFSVQELANSFDTFVDICLHRHSIQLYSTPPSFEFMAAKLRRPTVKKQKG